MPVRNLFGKDKYAPLLNMNWKHDHANSAEGDADKSCVQFSSPVYFGDTEVGSLELHVIRKSHLETSCSVHYETIDESAKAGVTYHSASGVVNFEAGEYSKVVKVTFVKDHYWSSTLDFKVALSNPDGCILGRYGASCRVKCVSVDAFPSSNYADKFGKFHDKQTFNSGLPLFLSYCKWNIHSGGLLLATIVTLFFDQLENVYTLVIIYVDMYLVNHVLNLHTSSEADFPEFIRQGDLHKTQEVAIVIIAAIHILPWSVLVLWDYTKVRMDIEGQSTHVLQQHLFRTFMNLNPSDLEKMGPALEFSMLSEAPKVAGGFASMLAFIRSIVDLLLNVWFVTVRTPKALPFAGLVLFVIFLWGMIRECFQLPGIGSQWTAMTHIVKESSVKNTVIVEYRLRPHMNVLFAEASDNLRKQSLKKNLHVFRTKMVLHVIAPIIVGCYVVYGGFHVLDGLGVGTFLGMIKVIHTMAKESSGCYLVWGEITQTFKPLRNITNFFNRDTEEPVMKKEQHSCHKSTDELMNAMENPDFDSLPVRAKELSYTHKEKQVLADVNFDIKQGVVIGVYGTNTCGKNVLMKLMGGITHATDGQVFVPSHLRSLLVNQDPVFLDRSLLTNLTQGCDRFSEEDKPRLDKILTSLSLDQLIPITDQDMQDQEASRLSRDNWSHGLSRSEKARLSIARAFIMNPELMVMQRPFAHFGNDTSKIIMDLFKDHVKGRGLHLDEATVDLRRPRTVVFTADIARDCKGADIQWEMVKTGKVSASGEPIFTVTVRKEKGDAKFREAEMRKDENGNPIPMDSEGTDDPDRPKPAPKAAPKPVPRLSLNMVAVACCGEASAASAVSPRPAGSPAAGTAPTPTASPRTTPPSGPAK